MMNWTWAYLLQQLVMIALWVAGITLLRQEFKNFLIAKSAVNS